MRVAIPHSLGREEVRRRLRGETHRLADYMPGGMAEVVHTWPTEDRMDLSVKAMGSSVDGHVLIEDAQVVFEVKLPLALSFIEPMIAGAVEEKGRKLLEKK